MAAGRRKRAAPSPISIGNCSVEIEGDGIVCESTANCLGITFPGVKIKVSVDDSLSRSSNGNLLSSSIKSRNGGDESFPLEDHELVLVSNPKDADSCTKSLLQDVLEIYMEELPAMNYAANTGKECLFLERCVYSGKYRTLILRRSNTIKGLREVIAAVSYQIIPTDTQYAEIPLAAVSSKYQSKGIGCLLYNELRERLQNVGVLAIFCWADKESVGFWLKQGFISIGEVDSKGKARRLPVKADIRRALCFPGCSTLMVSHLKKDIAASVHTSKHVSLCSTKSKAKPASSNCTRPALLENMTDDTLENHSPREPMSDTDKQQIGNPQTQRIKRKGHPTEGDSLGSVRLSCHTNPPNIMANSTTGVDLDFIENKHDSDHKHCCSGQNVKTLIWEASSSSLKSKRVRGGHLIDCCEGTKQGFVRDHVTGKNSTSNDCSLDAYGCRLSDDIVSEDPKGLAFLETNCEEKISDDSSGDKVLERSGPRVMLMNIADDAKKTGLTKIVEKLGGSVTCSGSASTHVITGKARRTLNFCIALCCGAWIVSPHWLKASFREGKFLGEAQFLLEDEEYRSKYNCQLSDAVMRAKESPHTLLRGFDVCLAKHIQPSVVDLSAIVKSAGGNVIRKLDSIKEDSRVIFLACEEDMEEAMIAAKKGVQTFSSDWLLTCVMKQELDLEAPQFAESL